MSCNTIITISRQYGSGGRTIGKKLAQHLEIPFYDNELISISADKSGISQTYFKDAESTAINNIVLSLSTLAPTTEIYGLPLNEKIFLIQSKVIKDLAEEGPCVIVGRCADYILQNYDNCVNVFIHSSLANRVRRAVTSYNLPEKGAETAVSKTDKRRANYYNYFTNKRWGDAQNYELVLNSDKIGLDNTVELIQDYIKRKQAYLGTLI